MREACRVLNPRSAGSRLLCELSLGCASDVPFGLAARQRKVGLRRLRNV